MGLSDADGDLRFVSAPIASSDSDADQEETSKFETCVKPLSTEWTNEKHSLHLKSIEASFVEQLFSTTRFPGFETSRKSSTGSKPRLRSSVRTLAGQFKTLRGGCWQKINVGKGELQPDGRNMSYDILSNSWIRHYIHSETHRTSSVFPGKAAAFDHRVFADNDTEASGQNFINEDIMEEKTSSLCSTQLVKIRAPMNDSSRNYQIDL